MGSMCVHVTESDSTRTHQLVPVCSLHATKGQTDTFFFELNIVLG